MISPFHKEKTEAVIGPVLVKNWKDNTLTRGIFLDYIGLKDEEVQKQTMIFQFQYNSSNKKKGSETKKICRIIKGFIY